MFKCELIVKSYFSEGSLTWNRDNVLAHRLGTKSKPGSTTTNPSSLALPPPSVVLSFSASSAAAIAASNAERTARSMPRTPLRCADLHRRSQPDLKDGIDQEKLPQEECQPHHPWPTLRPATAPITGGHHKRTTGHKVHRARRRYIEIRVCGTRR